MAITASGAHSNRPEQNQIWPKLRAAGLTALLSLGLWASVLGMANRPELLLWAALASLPALWICLPISGKRKTVIGLALAIVLLIAALLMPQARNGLSALLNALFSRSEAQQRYLYEMFSGADTATVSGIRLGILLFGCGLSVLLSLLAEKAHLFAGCIPIALLLLAAAYFGVTPPAIWMLGTAAVSALLLTPHPSFRQDITILLLFVLVGGLGLWLAPGENARVSNLDESLRDRLALSTVSETQPDEPSETPQETPEPQELENQNAPLLVKRDRTLDIKIVMLIVVIVLALLFLFIPAIARDRLQKRNDRLRAGMDSEDNRVAACAAFRYAVSWLKAAGVDFSNLPYGSVSDRVQEIVSPERAEAFSSMVPLWQEAQFSDHAISDEARATLSRFQEDTAQEIWSSKNRREQFRLRWKHALWI